ncbi:DNA internalization-related competence protein ComEC/Rec2 [Salipaludibacillus keqinensis]|uniref:DNA internalization-related competence protein ComEC/Rec2 n=1 Tax=Salipaludibacillus keqinensis TaxID=2045207 RepID=A0A323TKM3_9BACI|nr:DNA internalization-related competence protein ComEC/Rec2 [Salipaludibacillus keqinensis]PYZ94227.1 DNA internalization-related competence protein ComEC/Rec2 [Salipaludibacillus keqinensis]
MGSRLYCAAFLAISGLLFAFNHEWIWPLLFLVVGLFPHIKSLIYHKSWINMLSHVLIGFLFFLFGSYFIQQHQTMLTGSETTFQGSVETLPKLTASQRDWSFQLLLDKGEKIQVFYPYDKVTDQPVNLFDTCHFKASLDQPPSSKNPYSFDYKHYLSTQNIHWIARIPPGFLYCEQANDSLLVKITSLREQGMDKLAQKNDPETSALMTALVFGDRSFMNEERVDQYQQLGILHLLAVSGLHVGLITAACFALLYRIGFTREISSLIVFCLLPVYMIIAGGAPSVIRASFMCMIFLLVVRFKWKVRAVDVVAAIALFLLLVNPLYLYHLGFQLSFLTSFALLLSSSLFQRVSAIQVILTVTGIAQFVTLPLTLYHFYELSLFTLPMNLFFIPFISFWILPLAFLTVLLPPMLSNLTYWIASKSLVLVGELLSLASSPSWSVLTFGQPSSRMMMLMVGSVIASMILFEKKRKLQSGLLISLVFSLQWLSPYLNENATVTMLDVGQGDAHVIELPYRRGVYVIDTGGVIQWGERFEQDIRESTGPGKNVLEPFLKGKGIRSIDRLILSHGHIDHIGETCYISSKFRIKKALYPKGEMYPDEAKSRIQCLINDGVPLVFSEKGMSWQEGDDWFYVLHPEGQEDKENDQSIVLLASLNEVTFLFTGDLEEAGEKKVLNNFPNLKVDVLKVAHHGSNTSTHDPFIGQVTPAIGLISAGENNRFGHPHMETLQKLENMEIEVFRTDEQGAVTIEVKKSGDIVVKTQK